MAFEITGKLVTVCAPEVRGNYTNQKIWVDIEGQYPDKLVFELSNALINVLDGSPLIGKEVTISFNVKGNEWQGKRYPSLKAYKVIATTAPMPAQKEAPLPKHLQQDNDDLPF